MREKRMAAGRRDPNGAGFLRGGSGSLARALNSKIGRWCHFTHTDGRVIEGTYRRGRRVVQLTGMSRIAEQADGSRGFNLEETVWTVPRHIRITFGPVL